MNKSPKTTAKMNFSLSNKITFILSVAVIAIMLIFGVTFYQLEKNDLLSDIKKKSNQKIEILAGTLSWLLWYLDETAIDNLILSELKDENVFCLLVKDKYEKIYKGRIKINNNVLSYSIENKDLLKNSLFVFRKNILFQTDISSNVPSKIGEVELYISNNYVKKRLREIIFRIMIITVSLIIVIVAIPAFLFKKYILQRFSDIINSIKEIEKGNYSNTINISGNDELSYIAENVRSMSQTILKREYQLTKLQKLLSNIIESMPSIIISVDNRGHIVKWNTAASKLEGFDETAVTEKVIWELLPSFKKFENYFSQILETNNPILLRNEIVNIGGRKYFNISLFPLVQNGDSGVVFRLDDITDIHIKDEQLRQSQKMETIGILAGGLAHDFNNILGGITGTASLIQHRLEKNMEITPLDLKKSIEIIEDSAAKAADIVQQLLIISKKHETTFSPFDLNTAIRNTIKICEITFDKCTTIKTDYIHEPALIYGDKGQIEQVLLNLCVNGYHAMTIMRGKDEKQGGTLTIGTGNKFNADLHFCSSHPEAVLNTLYWTVYVKDTGIGMTATTMSKIFDPFFTTKDKGTGTGLGLSMVYNIIQQHKGFIDIYSEEGTGSTFTVYIPVHRETRDEINISGKGNIPRGEGKILVIDDELIIRNTTKSILEECGYTVILSEDGEEGVKTYSALHKEIKAVILDTVMPKMSGRETFLELIKINKDVKVLLSSGFKMDNRIESLMNLGIKTFLQKPYTLEKLSAAIYDTINNS